MAESEIDYRIEYAKITAKVNRLERDIFRKDLELLILKDKQFSHVDYSSIDEDGIDMLNYVLNEKGWELVKIWLGRMFPLPTSSFSPRIRMLDEVMNEIKKR